MAPKTALSKLYACHSCKFATTNPRYLIKHSKIEIKGNGIQKFSICSFSTYSKHAYVKHNKITIRIDTGRQCMRSSRRFSPQNVASKVSFVSVVTILSHSTVCNINLLLNWSNPCWMRFSSSSRENGTFKNTLDSFVGRKPKTVVCVYMEISHICLI